MINDKSRPAKSKIGHIPPQIDIHDNSRRVTVADCEDDWGKEDMPKAHCKWCGSLIVGEDALGHVCVGCRDMIQNLSDIILYVVHKSVWGRE